MPLDQTSFAFALKQLWVQSRIRDLTYKDHPFFAMVKKNTKAGGDTIQLSTRYSNNQRRSSTFANAQANTSTQAGKKFQLTRASDYAIASVKYETVKASEGQDAALIKAMDSEIESAFSSLVQSAAISLFGSGTGRIGQIAASGGISSAVITLSEPNDIVNFEVGQVLQLSATDGAGAGVRTGTVTVAGVDRDAGTITCSANVTTGIAAAANSDYIFAQGDYDAKIKGVAAWVPSTAPTSTLFFNVDRTADVNRLGGIRFNGSSYTISDALIKASRRAGREGASIDYGWFNYDDYANLELELGNKVQYVDVEAKEVGLGFRGIKVTGPKTSLIILPDKNAPKGRAFLTQMDTWTLFSVGEVPFIQDLDGSKFLRESTADNLEARCSYYAQLGTDAPGFNVNLLLPT
jgi:hypothetical protein